MNFTYCCQSLKVQEQTFILPLIKKIMATCSKVTTPFYFRLQNLVKVLIHF